jgi:hypothetical protein
MTGRGVAEWVESSSEEGLSALGRLGLAGCTAFYAFLCALTIRVAFLGGAPGHQLNANGALGLVSRPLLGKAAIAAVALGFVLFGIARLVGAVQDRSVSTGRRWMTAAQGTFYLILAWVPGPVSGRQAPDRLPAATAEDHGPAAQPAGRPVDCGRIGPDHGRRLRRADSGRARRDFRDGLQLEGAPRLVRRLADGAGAIGIAARSLVFMPIGIFLIVAAIQYDPNHSYGTDAELLQLSGHLWGVAVLAVVSAGLAVFVVFSCIETRYRNVVSAR